MYRPDASLLHHTARMKVRDVSVGYTVVTRGAGHMLSEKSQRTENTMFVDLDWHLKSKRVAQVVSISWACYLRLRDAVSVVGYFLQQRIISKRLNLGYLKTFSSVW